MPETIELTLTGIATGGDAIGRNPDSGKIVFVADAIPGERVQVQIVEDQQRWQRGQLVAIMEASPDRTTPPCPYFGPSHPVSLPNGSALNPKSALRCAGCQWQHIRYERQLALKRELVIDQLTRLGGLAADAAGDLSIVGDVIALGDPNSPEPDSILDYRYRGQMRFHLDAQGRLALPARDGSWIAIETCWLLEPLLDDLHDAFEADTTGAPELLQELQDIEIAVGTSMGEELETPVGTVVLDNRTGNAPEIELDLPVNIFLRRGPAEQPALEILVGGWGHRTNVGEHSLLVCPSASPQRTLVWPHAYGDEVLAMVAADLLNLQPFDELLDLWAGVGTFSVLLADQVGTVLAIEEEDLACGVLEQNITPFDNVSYFRWQPDQALPQLIKQGYRATVAILKPPEMSWSASLFSDLTSLGVRRFAIITDDLTGLSRRVKEIQANGFSLDAVQPVDLYPQTDRVTTIALFART